MVDVSLSRDESWVSEPPDDASPDGLGDLPAEAWEVLDRIEAEEWAEQHTDDDQEHTLDAAAAFARARDTEVYRLRVREAARESLAAERAAGMVLPPLTRLDAFLSVPDEPVTHRVAGLWPTGGRVVLSAPAKVGKTTTVGNTIRSLVDGEDFLGQWPVAPVGRLVLVDNELDERMLRRWLRAHRIGNAAGVELVPLRGRTSSFDLLDPATRTRWAELIGPADVLVLDCLRPALDALGLDENHEAGRFLEALDELAAEAGIGELLVVHHMGHAGERSRGDSRILDWPDANWRLIRDAEDDDAAEVRRVYFTARGRDVDQPETLLGYDPTTRRLSVAGGTRKDTRMAPVREAVLELLAGTDAALSTTRVEEALRERGHGRDQIRAALKMLRASGEVVAEHGPRRALLHTLNPSVRGSARECAARTANEYASAPIGRTLAHSPVSEECAAADKPAHSLDLEQPTPCEHCGGANPDHEHRAYCPDCWSLLLASQSDDAAPALPSAPDYSHREGS